MPFVLALVLAQTGSLRLAPERRPLATALLISSAVASASFGVAAGVGMESAAFRGFGQPTPGWVAASVATALGVTFALSELVSPYLITAGLELPPGTAGKVRAGGASLAWPSLVTGGVGVVLAGVGAAMEQSRYATGQGLLAAGLLTALLSGLAHQVLFSVGAMRALESLQ